MRPHIVLQRLEAVADPCRIDAATLPDLAAPPTLPPHHLAESLDQIVRRQTLRQGARDLDGEVATANDDRHAVAVGSVERLVREEKQVFLAFVDMLQHQPDAVDVRFFDLGTAARGKLLAKARGLFLETLDLRL